MQAYKNIQYTFVTSFGVSRVGKSVTVSILDSSGNALGSGFTLGSVVELSDGSYSVTITFTTTFIGFIKWANTTDSLENYEPIIVINDFRSDITIIRKIEANRWKIASNQLTIYDDDGTTPYLVFDLKNAGVADGSSPDERVPA